MGLIIFILFWLVGIYLCFHLFSKTVLWVFEPMIKHLEYRDNLRLKDQNQNANYDWENEFEIEHQHEVALENESQIIYIYKVILNKLLNSGIDEDDDQFRR